MRIYKILLFIILFPTLCFANYNFLYNSPELTPTIECICKLPEAVKVIERANAAGMLSVRISCEETASFLGMWFGKTRTIYIHAKNNTLAGSIQTLIFELHNAIADPQFAQLWKQAREGTIDKDSFIEKAERIEFNNLKLAQALLEKGISRKVFPKECRLKFIPNFELYYYYQQLTGHSDWFSTQYDRCCPPHMRTPFKGTCRDLTKLSHEDREDLIRYFNLCDKLCCEDCKRNQHVFDLICKEKENLQCCLRGCPKPNTSCHRASQRYQLFQEVFGNLL